MSTVTTRKDGQPTWVELASEDPDGSRAFYGALLGWEFEVFGEEFGHYSIARKDGSDVAGVGPKPDGVPLTAVWNLFLSTSDVDATTARAVELGGVVAAGPMDVPGSGRFAMVLDVTGAMVGLWQSHGMDGFGIVAEPGAFAWGELWTGDSEAARAYYRDLFSYRINDMSSDGFVYATFQVDDDDVAGVGVLDPTWGGTVPPHWAVYFGVGDTDASVRLATELGGQVMGEAMDSPYGRMATLVDPQGAPFRVVSGTAG